jgi:hypothetical protein
MDFIEYCNQNKILLAVYPPYSTQTLQLLDVVVFKPLATGYSDKVAAFMERSQGLTSISKRDLFPLFYRAGETSFKETTILKAFEATGQCAPWRELFSLPPYSLPPWPPWSSAGVDGVAKLLPLTHTNRMRRRSARGAKLNLTATIRTQGARAMLLEEVNNILYIYYLLKGDVYHSTQGQIVFTVYLKTT